MTTIPLTIFTGVHATHEEVTDVVNRLSQEQLVSIARQTAHLINRGALYQLVDFDRGAKPACSASAEELRRALKGAVMSREARMETARKEMERLNLAKQPHINVYSDGVAFKYKDRATALRVRQESASLVPCVTIVASRLQNLFV